MNDQRAGFMVVMAMIVLGVATVGGALWGCPQYSVYSQRMDGQAELAKATSNRKIKTLEALQKMESAKSLAEAEVIRATGAAKANHILQNSLGGPEGYLQYLKIQAMENSKGQLIYVPTEAQLPITEAGRQHQ